MGNELSQEDLDKRERENNINIHLKGETEEERKARAIKQKHVLVDSIFQAIDADQNGYLDRCEVLDWLEREPYLQSPAMVDFVNHLLLNLDHEEDSRCSYREFELSFSKFTRDDMVNLVINLLRRTSKIAAPLTRSNSNGNIKALAPNSPQSPHDHHNDNHIHPPTNDDVNHRYLVDIFFHSIDVDRDGSIDSNELISWIAGDSYFREDEIRSSIQPLADRLNISMNPTNDNEKNRIDNNTSISHTEFESAFALVPFQVLRRFLVHLLSRSTTSAVTTARNARRAACAPVEASRVHNTEIVKHALRAVPPSSKWRLVSCLVRNKDMLYRMKNCLNFVVLGQSMIQHNLLEFQTCRSKLETLKNLFTKNHVIHTELETAILPPEHSGAKPTRDTVFFHAASASVLDSLSFLGVNLIAAANNHSGDMGEEGVHTLMKEFSSRQFVYGGIGRSAQEASTPCYLNTSLGKVAQVAFASKVPVNSEACDDPNKRAGVNILPMINVEEHILDAVYAEKQLNAIKLARKQADYVIAYHHNHYWEKSAVNVESQMGSWKRDWAHQCIDAGATMYVGHGDPRLQGIEIYNGCPIFYCLGNFVFQTKTEIGFYGSEVWESVIVEIEHHPIPGSVSLNSIKHSSQSSPLGISPVGSSSVSPSPSPFPVVLDTSSLNNSSPHYSLPPPPPLPYSNSVSPLNENTSHNISNNINNESNNLLNHLPGAPPRAHSFPVHMTDNINHSYNSSNLHNRHYSGSPLMINGSGNSNPGSILPYTIRLTPIVLNEIGDDPSSDNHLKTRGIPSLADLNRGRAVLEKLKMMSLPFQTEIEIEQIPGDSKDKDPFRVIGWVIPKSHGSMHMPQT